MKKIHKEISFNFYSLLIVSIFITACSSVPKNPKGIENACDILNTDKSWRNAFDNTFKEYGVPLHVVMAIIYQESHFVYDARPPRKKFLGVPTTRPSSAYGYAQALDSTWEWYKNKTGNRWAKRDNLPDAVDFIGWYVKTNYERTGVSKWEAKEQYLAYHEGSGGYLNQTYLDKPWLMDVSEKVGRHSSLYRQQLTDCYKYPVLDLQSGY